MKGDKTMTLAKLRQILDELSVERDGNDDLPVVFFGEIEAGEIENVHAYYSKSGIDDRIEFEFN